MTEGYCAGSDCQRFAVLIGEFGSKFESVSDKETMADLAKYFNNEGAAADGRHLPIANWFYWSWNPNSGDTGGLVDDEWVNLQWEKVEYLQDSLGLGRTPDGFVPLPPPSPAARPLPIVGNSPSSASTSPPASAAFPVCRLASTLVLLLFLSLLL
jgi:endoglucanase